MRKQQHPAHTCDHQKDRQRMLVQGLTQSVVPLMARTFALLRSALIKIFGSQQHHDHASPICDRVSKECADMPFLIAHAVKHNPEHKNRRCNDGQTMALEKSSVLSML